MKVAIVTFPETKVAGIRHVGPPSLEHETARKLVAWKLEQRLLDQARYRSYGLHYTDPESASSSEHRVDFCLSYDGGIGPNAHGIVPMTIPEMRCALARDIGSRLDNKAARYLYEEWLPRSGEQVAALPVVFHYVNVGPSVQEKDAITDVYLPLKWPPGAAGRIYGGAAMRKMTCLAALVCLTLGLAAPARAESLTKAKQKDVPMLLDAAAGMNSAYSALLIGETHDRVYFEYVSGIHASSSFTNRPKRMVYWLPRSEITEEQLSRFKTYKDRRAGK